MADSSSTVEGKINVNVRPPKVAYFIHEDDREALKRVVSYACTQWGGLRNLIIPVNGNVETSDIFQEALQVHCPDRFVSYLPDQQTTSLQESLNRLWGHRQIGVWNGDRFEKHDPSTHPLSVLPESLFDQPDSLTTTPGIRNSINVFGFDGTEEERLHLLCILGAIYPGQESLYEREMTVCPQAIGLKDPELWELQFQNSPSTSVLNLTGYNIRGYEVTGSWVEGHFTICVGSSIQSLCYFWDLRAIQESTDFVRRGRRTLLFPERLLDDSTGISTLVSFIRSVPAVPNQSSEVDILFVTTETEAADRLKAVLSQLPGIEEFSGTSWGFSRWTDRDRQPREADANRILRYVFSFPSLPGEYKEGAGIRGLPRKVALSVGRNEILFEPPRNFRKRYHQSMILDLESDIWARYPNAPSVAEAIWKHAWFSHYGLSNELHTPGSPTYLDIVLPTEWEAIQKYFAGRGFDVRVSRNGQYSKSVITLLGGLQGAAQIATKQTYLLLENLAVKSSKKIAQRIIRRLDLATLDEGDLAKALVDVEIIHELKRIPKTYHQLKGELGADGRTVLSLLNQLSEAQIIKRGFQIQCPNCGTPSWFPLQVFDEKLDCPGCSSSFALPVEYPQGSGKEIDWEYTLNTLVNRAMDQDALPPIFALHHLTARKPAHCVEIGLEIVTAGSSDAVAEFDFVFVKDQRLIGGECKVGVTLAEKDIATARMAADLGFREFYFCTLRRFDDESLGLIRSLTRELDSGEKEMTVNTLDGAALLGEALC